MTLPEMKTIAAETLTQFIEVMPEAPFMDDEHFIDTYERTSPYGQSNVVLHRQLLAEVGHTDNTGEKYAMAFACARLLTSIDAEEQVAYLKENNEDDLPELKAFQNCLFHLHGKMQNEKPWEITESFIAELGKKYLYFKAANSDLGDLLTQFGGEF